MNNKLKGYIYQDKDQVLKYMKEYGIKKVKMVNIYYVNDSGYSTSCYAYPTPENIVKARSYKKEGLGNMYETFEIWNTTNYQNNQKELH